MTRKPSCLRFAFDIELTTPLIPCVSPYMRPTLVYICLGHVHCLLIDM